jgi:hypothetical protein
MTLPLAKLKSLFWAGLLAWLALAALISTLQLEAWHKKSPASPFGIFAGPGGVIIVQDFSYNRLFLRAIEDRVTPHPYRFADQEKIARAILPHGVSGLTVAYSPVALVLASPLLAVPGFQAYAIYVLVCSAGIAWWFGAEMLPGVESWRQLAAAAVVLGSLCLLATYQLGQTAILTTPLIGALWAILRREGRRGWLADGLLALVFWALCVKPSVAVVPLMLLLAARAWRALALGVLLLALTWLWVAPKYGGLVTGLADYAYLLNHYNNADFTPFLRRDYVPGHDAETHAWFAFDRTMLLLLNAGLLAARWGGRLSASDHFQGAVWAFLLFSPYLLPSEDWLICLLIAEGAFFRSGPMLVALLKLALLAGVLNLRAGITDPLSFEVEYPLKCILGLWYVAEGCLERLPAPALETTVD